jgi:hypothetical protein
MLPETASELFKLKFTGLAFESTEPSPVPIVAQPVASAPSSGNPSRTIQRVIVFSCYCGGDPGMAGGTGFAGTAFHPPWQVATYG